MAVIVRDNYRSELEGQADFYAHMVEQGILEPEEVDFTGHTDGVFGNILLENKCEIKDDYFKALAQMIKYQARRMWAGNTLPKYMLANGINDKLTYVFDTADFIDEIEKVKIDRTSASKGNSSYHTEIKPIDTFNWNTHAGKTKLLNYKNSTELRPKYHVSINNIIGLSKQAYNKGLTKTKFLEEEIRYPEVLADRIYPYEEPSNDEFKKIMDVLNTPAMQRELGAFYTPAVYVKKAQEYLKNAIAEIPEGMNYVVIDRCAGTGNLEEGLSDDILSHCILNTLEYEESLCLAADFGDKVLSITQTDALMEDVLEEARPYVEDPNCVIIMYENPPYSEVGAGSLQDDGSARSNSWKNSLVYKSMKEALDCQEVRAPGKKEMNDLAHIFIWSAFNNYMNGEYDNYILFDPVKYWKNQNLVNKEFKEGCLCNRKAFHATASAISLIRWGNIDAEVEALTLPAISDETGNVEDILTIKKVNVLYSETVFDKRTFEDDYPSVALTAAGDIVGKQKVLVTPIANDNPDHAILGYFDNHAVDIDAKNFHFTRLGYYAAHGYYIRSDKLLETAAPCCAGTFPQDKWYLKNIYGKTCIPSRPDLKDKSFTRKCLLYMMLAPNVKVKNIVVDENHSYRNELAYEPGTVAHTAYWNLRNEPEIVVMNGIKYTKAEDVESYSDEDNLIKRWEELLNHVKNDEDYGVEEYNRLKENFGEDYALGFWEIIDDINIYRDPSASKKVKKYKKLDTAIKNFKNDLKSFYANQLTEDLFKYELVK